MTNWIACCGGQGGSGAGNYDVMPLGLIADKYIDNATGAEVAYNGWSCTDYIDISGITDFYISGDDVNSSQGYNAFYDSSKNFISNFTMAGHMTNIPSSAKYVRLSQSTSFMEGITLFKYGGNGSARLSFDLTLYRNGYQYNEDIQIARDVGGSGGTDVAITIMSFTATEIVEVSIVPFQLQTNTGSNDGYFELLVDGVSKYKKKLNTGTWTPLTDIVPVTLSNGETLECNVGFDNSHNGCAFYYRQYQNT